MRDLKILDIRPPFDMMTPMKFKFYIRKAVSWYPRFKMLEKTLVIEAVDLMAARDKVYAENPGWEVSMFWPI